MTSRKPTAHGSASAANDRLRTRPTGGRLRSDKPPIARLAVRRARQLAAAACLLLPGMLAAQGASSDATLKELLLNDGSAAVTISPAFDPGVTNYTASVDSGVRVVTVTATPTDDEATVVSEPDDNDTGADGIQVPLAIGANAIAITVTAGDGSKRTYEITVTRAAYCNSGSGAVTAVTGTPGAGLISDCNVLLHAKEILEGPDGLALNWSADLDMAKWTAIGVSGDRVTTVDSTRDEEQTIFSNSLQGTLPAELAELSALTVLRFQNVSLRGEIPEQLGDLSELTTLDLSSNRNDLFAFSGGFTGSIPASLGKLSRLEVLDLGTNRLVGEIPLSFRRLTSLKELDLGGNVDVDILQRPVLPATGLEGEIPIAVLMPLRNLQQLDLSFNKLKGGIPRELGAFEALEALHLHRNFLTGCIPGPLQRFTDLGNLKGINPQRNDYNYRTRDLPACPVPGPPTVTVVSARGGVIVFSYEVEDNGGEPVSRYEYRLSADGATTWNPDWTAIPDSGPGQSNADSYRLEGLTEGTVYTLELRAVNIDGAGPATSFSSAPEAFPDNALRDLRLRHGASDLVLNPDFVFDRLDYTVMVGDAVEVLTIVATPAQATATVRSDPGDDDREDGIQVPLDPGFNTIVLTVTAESGARREYRLTVVRNPTDVPAAVNAEPGALSLDEGRMASYRLVLAAQPVAEVTVAVGVRGSRSVRANPSRVTFTTSDWDRPQSVSVRAATDADDADERATLTHAASGAGYEVVSIPRVAVTVRDDNEAWEPMYKLLEGKDGKLVIVYDRQLDESSVPAPEDYEVTVDGQAREVKSVAVSGKRVTLTLEKPVYSGDVSIVYRAGDNPLRGVPEVGAGPSARVLLFESAANADRQGFVRIVNHSDEAGEVRIEAIDNAGTRAGPVTLDIGPGAATHFNADDLETGNADKGLPDGIGPARSGDWRLGLTSELDIEVLSYARTTDGFVTSLHDAVPAEAGEHRVVFFNPGRNATQVSQLRLINPNTQTASATIAGTDDAGASSGEVTVTLPADGAVALTAEELESGAGRGIEEGALGEGTGKWRLRVASDSPIVAMSLLESQGRLTNLSTAPQTAGRADGSVEVPLFPSASDPELKGFVRVINRSAQAGEVSIQAFDDTDRDYETVILALEAGAAGHFNSDDLELGNAIKGLTGSTGAGVGDWRLELTSERDIEVLAYIRTGLGFVTAMHDLAPVVDDVHRVVFLNPAKNESQVSRIRLVNPGAMDAAVTITGIDDDGASPSRAVRARVPAGASLYLTAPELESGEGDGIESGTLGVGQGKWRLRIESDQPIRVLSLLKSPTGHLTNLSTSPDRPADDG